MARRRFQRHGGMLEHFFIIAIAPVNGRNFAHGLCNGRATPCRGIELIVGFCGFALCVQRQAQQVVRLSIRVAQIAGVLDIERPAKQRFSLQIKPVAVAVFAQRDQRRQMFGIAPQRFLEIDVRTNLAVSVLIDMYALKVQFLHALEGIGVRIEVERLGIVQFVVLFLSVGQQLGALAVGNLERIHAFRSLEGQLDGLAGFRAAGGVQKLLAL